MLAKPKTLEELYSYLSPYRLFDVLNIVAQINAVFKFGTSLEELQYEGIDFELFQWIKYMNTQQRINLYFSSTRLARFILLSGAHNESTSRVSFKSQIFRNMLDYSIDLYDKDVEIFDKDFITPHILGKVSHWQFPLQESLPKLLGRANLLFLEIPREVSTEYEFDIRFQSYFGMSIKSYLGIGTLIWHKSCGYVDRFMEIDEALSFMSQDSYAIFLDLVSMKHQEYPTYFRSQKGTIASKGLEIYGVDPLKHRPLIIDDGNTYLIPQMKYFFDKVTNGVFHLLAEKERSSKRNENPFRITFGNIFKTYVGKFLMSTDFVQCLDLDYIDLDYNKKIPDYALISGDVCLLIEVKLSLTNAHTRSRFDKENVLNTIKKGSMNKALQQLDEFGGFIVENNLTLNHPFYKVKHVVSLIVCYEDLFVSNLAFLKLIESETGFDMNLQVCNISELESLGDLLSNGLDIVDILYKKAVSDKKYEPISSCTDPYQEKLSRTVLTNSRDRFFDDLIN
ncbi:hypothetical protein [Sphingobacterium spiritivorum]|uniref:hypothetical protein n=1 Tax=Sphingobacterium spiritivorum TaxID=258 RepID=UPI0019198BD1|nr:hypothetical protein [Sphingobacterium spiritivorum]QQT27637.1 hypothetical protein I6J02_07280 [Sphingobacterium spiritivorum]